MTAPISPGRLRAARQSNRLTQQKAADRIGVSQAYLALLESGRRPVTGELAKRIAIVYKLGPVVLPLSTDRAWSSSSLAEGLAALRYPGFHQRTGATVHNPALLLLEVITSSDVEVRVLEALPWLVVEYSDLDWNWLIRESKIRDAQNRLGYIVTLARQFAAKRGNETVAERLHQIELLLERSRLAREDTLCQESLSGAERRWLKRTRPRDATYWKLLTDLSVDTLPYAA